MANRKTRTVSIFLYFAIFISFACLITFSASAASNDTVGIYSGATYYIKNVSNGKYLNVHNSTDANGTDVNLATFYGMQKQKWRVVRNSDGTYTFYAVVSSNNRVLDVTGTNVDIWAYNSSFSSEKFTISREDELGYAGTFKIKNGNNYVVSDSTNSTAKVSSTVSGHNHQWSFELVDKDDADIYAFNYLGYDSRGANNDFIQNCTNMNYTAYGLDNVSSQFARNNMATDSIWVFRGHGWKKSGVVHPGVCFVNGNGADNGLLTAHSSLNIDSRDVSINTFAANALAKERCVLYIGCSTAATVSGYNLVDATFNKGAHFALGTTEEIPTRNGSNWVTAFFDKADTAASIKDCIAYANQSSNIGLPYYIGDKYAKLK